MWAQGKSILTVEGLQEPDGGLSPIQRAFVEEAAVQCGFCTPGFIMTAVEILESGKLYMTVDQNPEDQARAAVAAAVNLARGRAYDDGLRELLGNDCTDPEQPFVLRVPVEAVTA